MTLHGKNRVPEGLEFGELKIASASTGIQGLRPYQVIAYSYNLIPTYVDGSAEITIPASCIIDKLCSPVTFIACSTASEFRKLNQAINNKGYGDYIVSAFSVPQIPLINALTNARKIGEDYNAYILSGDAIDTYVATETFAGVPNNLDGYIPINKKLLQYPYVYLGFNAPNGSQNVYKFEDFKNGTPKFKIASEINPNPNVLFIPQDYNGDAGDSFQYMSAIQGYPQLSTRSDYFNSWLAQNSSIVDITMRQDAFNYLMENQKLNASAKAGIIKGGIANDVSELGLGLYDKTLTKAYQSALEINALERNREYAVEMQLAQIDKQKLIPDSVKLNSTNTTLLNYNNSDGITTLFYVFSIRRNFARRLDKFFSMYGYLTNDIKIPNLNNRPYWNYVKTIGANIVANIPQEDLEAIKGIFDNGITLWHDPSKFLNYELENKY